MVFEGMIYVPLTWCDASTIDPQYTKLGYAIIHDTTTTSSSPPRLLQSKLYHPIFANLTLGFYADQASAADGCPSKINWKSDSGSALAAAIRAWATKSHVSKECSPLPAQLRALVAELAIPVRFGKAVVRDVLHRVLRFVYNHVSNPALKEMGKGRAGATTTVNRTVAELAREGVFDLHASSSGTVAEAVKTTIPVVVNTTTIPAAAVGTKVPVPASPAQAPTPVNLSAQKVTEHISSAQKASQHSDSAQKATQHSESTQQATQHSDSTQQATQHSDSAQKVTEHSDSAQKATQHSESAPHADFAATRAKFAPFNKSNPYTNYSAPHDTFSSSTEEDDDSTSISASFSKPSPPPPSSSQHDPIQALIAQFCRVAAENRAYLNTYGHQINQTADEVSVVDYRVDNVEKLAVKLSKGVCDLAKGQQQGVAV